MAASDIVLPGPPHRQGYAQDGNSWRVQGAIEDEWREMLVYYLRNNIEARVNPAASVVVSAAASTTQGIAAGVPEEVDFGTEVWDRDDTYDANTYTVLENGALTIEGAITFQVTAASDLLRVYLYEGGVAVTNKIAYLPAPANAFTTVPYTFDVQAVKGEEYTVWGENNTNNDTIATGGTFMRVIRNWT